MLYFKQGEENAGAVAPFGFVRRNIRLSPSKEKRQGADRCGFCTFRCLMVTEDAYHRRHTAVRTIHKRTPAHRKFRCNRRKGSEKGNRTNKYNRGKTSIQRKESPPEPQGSAYRDRRIARRRQRQTTQNPSPHAAMGLELLIRFELMTSSLPRMCSTN